MVFQRVVGAIGASIGPEHFNASDEHEDTPWDEEVSTDQGFAEGSIEAGDVEEESSECEELV